MPRAILPHVEPLESKTLLSNLAVSVATDRSTYQVGQLVRMTLTETNTSNQSVKVTEGCGIDDFWATQAGTEVWRESKNGPQPLCPISLNGVLNPHQSRSFVVFWNGRSDEGPTTTPTGVVQVQGAVDGMTAAPVSIRIDPSPAASNVVLAVATNHMVYRPGERIRMSIIETNGGNEGVGVSVSSPTISIFREGTLVWSRHSHVNSRTLKLLKPGQSRIFQFAWTGRSGVPGVRVKPGSYTIDVALDGLSDSTTIQIARR
jgi:hypothetical protein